METEVPLCGTTMETLRGQPQFQQADHLHMVAGLGGHFCVFQPKFSFLSVSNRCAEMAKTPENKGFACPKNVQKNLKKKLTSPRSFVIFVPHTVTTKQKSGNNMRTKTLLIASAALAAGILASSAQTYSQNIVGYVTQKIQPGYNLLVCPVAVTSSNNAEQVFPNLQGGDTIALWDPVGQGYVFYLYTGPDAWLSALDYSSVNAPLLPVGQGFFYNNSSGVVTNTCAGTVILGNTNTLVSGYNLIGSTPPIGVSTIDSTNINITFNAGDTVSTFDAVAQSYSFYLNVGTGTWLNGLDYSSVDAPSLNVGQGFYYNNSGSAVTWTQNLIVP